ncbi:MAG: hypothetical protein H0X65_06840 [Gemmatimonadetes bacterium]|nr:hypothetical protein [Gemmatimonadota bacterium]
MNRILPGAAAMAALLLSACAGSAPEHDHATMAPAAAAVAAQDAFWNNLQALCEGAAEGTLLQAPDTQISPDARLIVHFRECGDQELRFPLHVDNNRSRTWVFIRHAEHLELRHDHRHEDGTEETNTWYGATTLAEGTANRQEFASHRNGMLIGWRVEIEPEQRFTYGTIRDGEWRHHLEFDLTRPVNAPPPPWGHETRPSQRP